MNKVDSGRVASARSGSNTDHVLLCGLVTLTFDLSLTLKQVRELYVTTFVSILDFLQIFVFELRNRYVIDRETYRQTDRCDA